MVENGEGQTEQTRLAKARVGQGRYRAEVMAFWGGQCALTGASLPELLVASHIRPWASCNDAERLDSFNGLLLVAHMDALFDSFLMSFDDTGTMLLSARLTAKDRSIVGLGLKLPRLRPHARHVPYLGHHRLTFMAKEAGLKTASSKVR